MELAASRWESGLSKLEKIIDLESMLQAEAAQTHRGGIQFRGGGAWPSEPGGGVTVAAGVAGGARRARGEPRSVRLCHKLVV